MITAIVCVSQNWAIGKDNDLVFKLKNDMEHFKEKTMNKIVVMGYNTLLSLPKSKPLKYRTNIVLCPEGIEIKGCICYHDFDKLVQALQLLSVTNDIYIMGGAMLYKSMLPYCDQVDVNMVYATVEDATAFFPNLDENKDFKIAKKYAIMDDCGYKTQNLIYENIAL